jgi:hypothetical protein
MMMETQLFLFLLYACLCVAFISSNENIKELDSSQSEPVVQPLSQSLVPCATSVTSSSIKDDLITALAIPASLTTHSKSTDLRLAYAKYQGFLHAQAEMYHMIKKGTWALRTPTTDELIEVFVSRSVWHDKYCKIFPKVNNHPQIEKWLKNDGVDVPPNTEVFGFEKQSYNFKDLVALIDLKETAGLAKKVKRGRDSLDKKKGKKGDCSEQGSSKKGRKVDHVNL